MVGVRLLAVVGVLALAAGHARVEQKVTDMDRVHGRFGLGVSLGAPDGLTLEVILGKRWAFDVAAGSNPFRDGRWYGHANLLYSVKAWSYIALAVHAYVGAGAALTSRAGQNELTDTTKSLRIPLGLQGSTPLQNFQLYIELAPRIEFDPETEVLFEGAIGFRFFR